mmetsp:Transcript_10741/g.30710  ORF Transcript_10741/g.30710 Transcript_10741/m.30710 type:complete len:204 (+) Transcript_10741:1212-1823(+)
MCASIRVLVCMFACNIDRLCHRFQDIPIDTSHATATIIIDAQPDAVVLLGQLGHDGHHRQPLQHLREPLVLHDRLVKVLQGLEEAVAAGLLPMRRGDLHQQVLQLVLRLDLGERTGCVAEGGALVDGLLERQRAMRRGRPGGAASIAADVADVGIASIAVGDHAGVVLRRLLLGSSGIINRCSSERALGWGFVRHGVCLFLCC